MSATSRISSSRGRSCLSLLPAYINDAISIPKYHPINTPNGAIQLSVAENKMVEDLLVPALQHFATSKNGTSGLFQSNQIYYQPTHGRPELRNAMSNYLQRLLKLSERYTLDEDGLVVGAGCNAVLENLCFCLAEQGDGVLVPTPYYAAFEFDLAARAGLRIIPVTPMACPPSNTNASLSQLPAGIYYPTIASLNAAYENSIASGSRPQILLLSHPNNPLGICYPPEVIHECIDWARDRKIHLVSDEIYAGSVYRNTSTFQSTLRLAAGYDHNSSGLGLGPYVHFVYALSKDFALSGMRVGVAYSENEEIRRPLQRLNDLCQISSQTQLTVEHMLSETDTKGNASLWCTDNFLPENCKRIQSRCDRLQQCLEELRIPYLHADSGLFVWMDMTEFLPLSPERHLSADEREHCLYMDLMQHYGLLFTPGRSMMNELPGFFRCVFTAASDEEFDLALERIQRFVKENRVVDSV